MRVALTRVSFIILLFLIFVVSPTFAQGKGKGPKKQVELNKFARGRVINIGNFSYSYHVDFGCGGIGDAKRGTGQPDGIKIHPT